MIIKNSHTLTHPHVLLWAVFGQLVDSPSQTLDALEKIPTEAGTDKPLRAIRILDVQIYNDPFEIYQEKLNKKLHRNDHDEILKREEKRKKRESDRTTWYVSLVIPQLKKPS